MDVNKAEEERKGTSIAASLHCFLSVGEVSSFERRSKPLAAIVDAEESAGRGGGIRGALKSLKRPFNGDRCL